MTMSTRTNEVVADVLAALHEVLERHQVTEQEWMAALAFLTEIGRADEFVLLSDVTRTSVLIDALSHADDEEGATASDVEGPLYVEDPPVREGSPAKIYDEYEGMGDADVLIVGGRVTSAGGGEPLPEAIVDVWQTGRTAATTSGTSASPRTTSAARSARTPTGATRSRRCSRSRTPCRRTARPAATWRRSANIPGGPRTSTSR